VGMYNTIRRKRNICWNRRSIILFVVLQNLIVYLFSFSFSILQKRI